MTVEDANKHIEIIERMMFGMFNHTVDGKRIFPTLKAAKEAIENQIPKKPLYHKEEQREGYTYLKQEFYKCPSCNKILYIQNHKERTYPGCRELNRYPQGNRTNHCCYCGQAIDWSDAECVGNTNF